MIVFLGSLIANIDVSMVAEYSADNSPLSMPSRNSRIDEFNADCHITIFYANISSTM